MRRVGPRVVVMAGAALSACLLSSRPVTAQAPPIAEPAIEARDPTSSSSDDRRLARVDQAVIAEDWQSAVEQLQFILDLPQDALWRGASLKAEAETRIGRLPAPGRDIYRAEYGGLAARLLQEAQGTGALRGAAVVANRFFHTDAGKQATAKVASLLFDRGEYRASAAWYARLVHEPAYRDSVDWRARATFALVQAGEQSLAEPLLESLAQQPAAPLFGRSQGDGTLAGWILKHPERPAVIPQLRDWLTIYGNATHVGVAPPCEPLLLERWAQPHTARYAIVQQLQSLLLDLGDNQKAPIPELMPIVVGRRAAFRTFRGLAVVDCDSGELLWETAPPVSAERQLANEPPRGAEDAADFSGVMSAYGDSSFEHHPLSTLLFRDAGFGQLSSDGRAVFSIENSVLMPVFGYGMSWGGSGPAGQDPYKRDWTANQIHAHDLATGERLWEAGGRLMHEAIDSPLAGVFFFGPPVADGEELFAIGERDHEIRLYALSPTTGELLWSQSLAQVDDGIEQDARRLWACIPAVDAGLVICPTTAGWLVAVDRQTHRITWAHRYVEPPEGVGMSGNSAIHSMPADINQMWSSSAPVLTNGAIIVTPPELPDQAAQEPARLYCLDARTGAERWNHLKDESLYLAGVFGQHVVIVRRTSIDALNLIDGKPLWSLPIPPTDGPPSGRGIASGAQFLLPLQSGQLWTINLSDGLLARRAHLPQDAHPLGNLAVWNGLLLSEGPFGLVGFEQREQLEQEIAGRLQTKPDDLWAAVRQAEIHMAAGEYTAAINSLEQTPTDFPPGDADLAERRRVLSFQALLASLRSIAEDNSVDLERAAKLARGDDELLELERLTVDQHMAAGRWQQAADRCFRISAKFANDRLLEEGLISLRLDVWLRSRLAAIAAQAPPDVANSIAEQIAEILEQSAVASPAAASLERIYGFHPAALGYVWRLIEEAAFRRDFAGAEVRLRRLLQDGDRATQAAALARLGDLLIEFNQRPDAAAAFDQLESEFADVLLPSLQTGAETAQDRFMAAGPLDRELLAPPSVAEWSRDRFEVRHSRVVSTDAAVSQPPVIRQLQAEFFRRHSIEFDPQSPVMSIRREADDSVYWRLSLRTTEGQVYNQSAGVLGSGLQVVVLHRGMVHAMSVPDRRLLWSRPVAESSASPHQRQIYEHLTPILQSAAGFASRTGIATQSPTGLLAVANPRYVAVYGRGEFSVLDPLTGEILWKRRGIAPNTLVRGDEHTVYVIPPGVSPFALNAADGRPQNVDDLPSLIDNSIAITSARFIRLTRQASALGPRPKDAALTIAAIHPLTKQTAWTHDFAARSRLTFLDDRQLFVLDEISAECSVLELESGRLQKLGKAPTALLSQSGEMSAIADPQNVYLILNDTGNHFSNYIHLPSLRVSGTVVAFHRDGSGLAWKQAVENQNLLLPQFSRSPLLLFLAYDNVPLAEIEADYANVRLLALDKGDGHVVVDDLRATPNGNHFRIDLDRAHRAIELHAHNERVRIQAVKE